ncbi:hypothetical protein NQZ68_029682 [Dissostichus eleginoides]|nr:hypothetical protein NQZ68_029682 [Dissostichus eleginoides]
MRLCDFNLKDFILKGTSGEHSCVYFRVIRNIQLCGPDEVRGHSCECLSDSELQIKGFSVLRLPANQIPCSDQAAPYISQSQRRTSGAPQPAAAPSALPRLRQRCRFPFTLLGQRRAAAAVLPPDCRVSVSAAASPRQRDRGAAETPGEPEENRRRERGEPEENRRRERGEREENRRRTGGEREERERRTGGEREERERSGTDPLT